MTSNSSKSKRRIVIDDAVPFAETLFGELGDVILMPGRAIDADAVREADALIVRSRTRVNAELLAGSRVRFVGSTVVGLDHVDQPWLAAAGISFYSAQGCNATAVAEYVIAGLLTWTEARDMPLAGLTLAIIGVGHVGTQVWQRARALGLTCLLNDPPRAAREPDFPHTPLAQCLQQADIITLHTPLTDAEPWPTRHLLDAERLQQCAHARLIINAARGGIIDEHAWREHPGDRIIDCWQNEPHIDETLFARAWLATPHIAGHSLDAKLRGGWMVAQRLRQHWGLPPLPEALAPSLLPAPEQPRLPPLPTAAQACAAAATRHAWDFRADQYALLDEHGQYAHKNFEYHRRHYPPRREWHAFHPDASTPDACRNLLKSIGFSE